MKSFLGIIFLYGLLSASAMAQSCNTAPKCKAIKSCKQAAFYLEKCGVKKLDKDGDGIPCEAICGQTKSDYNRLKTK